MSFMDCICIGLFGLVLIIFEVICIVVIGVCNLWDMLEMNCCCRFDNFLSLLMCRFSCVVMLFMDDVRVVRLLVLCIIICLLRVFLVSFEVVMDVW